METIYLLLPIIGAFVFLFLGCCFGRKMKEMLHIPKQVVLGRAVMEQLPGVRVQEESESEDECPTIRVKFRDRRGRQLTGLIPSSASRDSVLPSSCSDSGVALLSASRQSIPPGTSVSGLLKRRYLDVDSTCSPSRLSLDSAIHASRTYNFSPMDSDDEDGPQNEFYSSSINPRRITGLLMRNSADDEQSEPMITYGPPNWDHVVIIESLPENMTSDASSLSMVTDCTKQHSFQNVQMLYDSGLSIRNNPLSAIQQAQSLQEVICPRKFNDSDVDSPENCGISEKRLSVSLCSLYDSHFKDLEGISTRDSSQRDSDVYADCQEISASNRDLRCDNHGDSTALSSTYRSTPSINQAIFKTYNSGSENNSTTNEKFGTGSANEISGPGNTSSNSEDNSNGNSATVEPPGVFPLLSGVAALVDNMKESNSATFRKISGTIDEMENNNCCIEVDVESGQTEFNKIPSDNVPDYV